jgi:hypothetical protein
LRLAIAINGNQLQFALSVNPATFVRKHEWNHRKGNGMTVELEKFTVWRHSVEARLTALEEWVFGRRDWTGRQQGSFSALHAELGEMGIQLVKQDGVLEVLHRNQFEQSTALRELRAGQDELRRNVTEIQVGIRTIIDLIGKRDVGDASGTGLPEGGQVRD